jgi:Cu2+-exporting ATPase
MEPKNNLEIIIYSCPMHPEVRQDNEGICPKCGMKLLPEIKKEKKDEHSEHSGFNKHEGHSTNIFKVRFLVSFILTLIILFFDLNQNVLVAIASIIFFYGGWIFIASAYREMKAGLPGMMTLISLAISVSYLYSNYVVLIAGKGETLFVELATLITIMLLGHWLEMRAVTGAQGALSELSKLLPDKVEVKRGDLTEVIRISEVSVGDIVLVKPGGRIPTDGVVEDGSSDVDESVITGESKPIGKIRNSEVVAGTINGDGALKIRVTKIGEETFLAGIIRLVAEAQSSKSRLQILSDRAAYYLTIIAVTVGGITFFIWSVITDASFAVQRMVAVLVISCPHALGLAIPLVASISTTKAAKNGFIIKKRLSLEAARAVDVVLFDKTGTLTKGEFGVDTVVPIVMDDVGKILMYAASVNSQSEHSIAGAILTEVKKRNIPALPITNFQRIAGKGARAEIDGKTIFVGSETLLSDGNLLLDTAIKNQLIKLSTEGKTVVFVIRENSVLGAIALADIIREESYRAIGSLRDMGIKTAMMTGDTEDVAKWVADKLGIDEYFAKVLPEQKSEKVKLLQAKGLKVAMVGDGVNDAPALAQSDIGIAIGAGTNVAIESAGIVLVKNDPRDIAKIIRLSRLTYSKMIQNLFWATGYNVIAIPLAAGVLASKGVLLEPSVGAILMSLSTVIVAINAMLLRRAVL